jgi:hypothetical protein
MDIFPLISAAEATAEQIATPGRGTLDSILNFVIPLAVFVMFGFMVYKNFGTEIDKLVVWIKKQMAEKEQPQQVPINNPYMADGTIVYR